MKVVVEAKELELLDSFEGTLAIQEDDVNGFFHSFCNMFPLNDAVVI